MPGEGPSLSEYFTEDHRRCDARWAQVEQAAEAGDAEGLVRAWRGFETAMRAHLDQEEQVLFPAFESQTGMGDAGPTRVMRSEHARMRALLDVMGAALERGDTDELLDQGDTLLLLIQQHNQKEEHMLYPLSQRALAADWPALRSRLEAWPRPTAVVPEERKAPGA